MNMYVHHSTVYNSKDLKLTQIPIGDKLDRENVYIMEFYAAIQNEKFES